MYISAIAALSSKTHTPPDIICIGSRMTRRASSVRIDTRLLHFSRKSSFLKWSRNSCCVMTFTLSNFFCIPTITPQYYETESASC